MKDNSSIIGIDIGGTKISVCLGDRHGTIRQIERFPTADVADPVTGVERTVAQAVQLLEKEHLTIQDVDAIGLGAPGPLSVKEGVIRKTPNMPSWRDFPVVRELTKRFGMPVHFNNDANACALAEFLFGEYRGTQNMVYLTASTGMGGGVIANGRILQGAADCAGEVGHMVLDPEGPPCLCGLRGCFEVYCGGKSVAETTRKRIVEEHADTLILDEADGDPDRIDFKAIGGAMRRADPLALEIWDAFTERLAQGVGQVLMAFNPDVILFGTIALNEGDRFFDPLREKLPRYAWRECIDSCTLAPSTLGKHIGDLGALAIAVSHMEP